MTSTHLDTPPADILPTEVSNWREDRYRGGGFQLKNAELPGAVIDTLEALYWELEGIGLANCADFVAAAFGLNDLALAVAQGYVGTWFGEGRFAAWAHWPAMPEARTDNGSGPTTGGVNR